MLMNLIQSELCAV